MTGFDLTTRDLYFMSLVEVFTNRILAENKYFTNHVESLPYPELFSSWYTGLGSQSQTPKLLKV